MNIKAIYMCLLRSVTLNANACCKLILECKCHFVSKSAFTNHKLYLCQTGGLGYSCMFCFSFTFDLIVSLAQPKVEAER